MVNYGVLDPKQRLDFNLAARSYTRYHLNTCYMNSITNPPADLHPRMVIRRS